MYYITNFYLCRELQKQGITVDYVHPGSLDYGGSPTHTKIHVGRLILDWGERRDTQKYNVRGFTQQHKDSRLEVQEELFKVLQIHVNEPRAGISYFLYFFWSFSS